MRSNKSGLAGLITEAISTNAGFVKPTGLPDLFIVQGVQKAIDASGKTPLNSDTGGRPERVAELMRTFDEHRVEGMTYVGDHHRYLLLLEMAVATILVLANCYDDAGTPSVLPTGKTVSFRLRSKPGACVPRNA